LELRR